ncbi:hypothetical protein H5154_03335 [Pseudoalteromonas sp. SR44-5]|uniref:hypothetical protein n=1 Tax=Pseudoalteromonas sp. SR44-5 TaxID=2760934 RepID=UPI0016015207|nr:hypothetical protein [Pseudoalteromonas sp. SR44-5]MBB1365420.1 hypothetical protein [Pseudoalteromonas sp. SR44-5]
MSVDEFIKMLDDPAVKERLRRILADDTVSKVPLLPSDSCFVQNEANDKLKAENDELPCESDEFNQKMNKLIEEKHEMEELIRRLKVLFFGVDSQATQSEVVVEAEKIQVNEVKSREEVEVLRNTLKAAQNNIEKSNEDTVSLQAELDAANKKVQWYCDNFSEDIKVDVIYKKLSEATKSSLSGIFKSTTPSGLIACGIQEKNIGNLWEYAKNEVVNGKNPDVAKINEIFEVLFARFTLAFPMYETQQVTLGDDFDTQLYIKHNTSRNASGVIEAILLRGYLNTKTGKVIKQSIVVI